MKKALGFFSCGQKFILNKQRLEHYMQGQIPPCILQGDVTISQINSRIKKMKCSLKKISSKLYYRKICKRQLTNKSVFPGIPDCLMTQNNNITKALQVLSFRSSQCHAPHSSAVCCRLPQCNAEFSLRWFLDDCLLIRNEVLVCLSTRCEDKKRRKEIK